MLVNQRQQIDQTQHPNTTLPNKSNFETTGLLNAGNKEHDVQPNDQPHENIGIRKDSGSCRLSRCIYDNGRLFIPILV